jgi:acylphosphatase
MTDLACMHILVEGRVQGVGFRYFVQAQANQLGLTGWVRNLEDGRVEILAEGEKKDILELLDRVRTGPRGSIISEIKFDWAEAAGNRKYFMIAPTG